MRVERLLFGERGSPRRCYMFLSPGHNQVAPARPPGGRATIRTATAGTRTGGDGLLPESRPVVALERSCKGCCSLNEGLHILLIECVERRRRSASRRENGERRGGVSTHAIVDLVEQQLLRGSGGTATATATQSTGQQVKSKATNGLNKKEQRQLSWVYPSYSATRTTGH